MRPGVWQCGSRERRGWVRANKITLSGAARCSGRGRARGDTHGDANPHAAGCLAMPCHSVSCRGSHLFLKNEHVHFTCISLDPQQCGFASLCVSPCARPLPLQRAALLRVILFARTRPRCSRLPRHQTPGRVRIRVAVCARTHVPPPAAARDPAEGYFTRASPSAAVPGAHPSQSGAPGLAFSRFSAESPGRAFVPLSATGLGFGKAGTAPEKSFYLN